jgi:uncharacterized protein (TIGR03086 family)
MTHHILVTETARLGDLARLGAAVQQLVDGVRDDQWSAPTPCPEWTVRQLVNHLVLGMNWFAGIALGEHTGRPSPEARATDWLRDDPRGAFAAAVTRMLDAFSAPGFAEKTFATPIGDNPGTVLVEMRTTELLVHGWDLARATGQDSSALPQDTAERTLQDVRTRFGGAPRQPGGMFGTEQPAPAEALATDRLAAFLGRPI